MTLSTDLAQYVAHRKHLINAAYYYYPQIIKLLLKNNNGPISFNTNQSSIRLSISML